MLGQLLLEFIRFRVEEIAKFVLCGWTILLVKDVNDRNKEFMIFYNIKTNFLINFFIHYHHYKMFEKNLTTHNVIHSTSH
jgi:hypothetical protein